MMLEDHSRMRLNIGTPNANREERSSGTVKKKEMVEGNSDDFMNEALAALLAVAYMYAFIGLNRQSILMIFGPGTSKSVISTTATTTQVDGGSVVEVRGSNSSSGEILREDKISTIVPLINLVISLIIGVYMIPVVLQAAASFGL